MKTAIILHGPSGAGKTTLARQLVKKYDFKHCDLDYFMLAFSRVRSRERSDIASLICYRYGRELVKRGFNIIIEAMSPKFVSSLKKLLRSKKYKVLEISLDPSLEQCLRQNKSRTERKFSDEVIRESYHKHRVKKGLVIDVSKLSAGQVFGRVKFLLEK